MLAEQVFGLANEARMNAVHWTLTWLMRVALALLGFADNVASSATQAPLPVVGKDALGSLEAAIESIRTFDVYLKSERVMLMKVVVKNKGTAVEKDGSVLKFQSLSPGEVPKTTVEWSRQVRGSDGKQRFEVLRADGIRMAEVVTYDSEVVKSFVYNSTQGSITGTPPDQRPFTKPGEGYEALYRDAFLGGDIVAILRKRKGLRANESERDGKKLYMVESPPEAGDWYPSFGWRIALSAADPARWTVFGER